MSAFLAAALLLIAAVSAQAATINVGTEVFSDDFSGASLRSDWATWIRNGGTITPDAGAGVVTISTSATTGAAQLYSYNSTLNFGSSPNDWAVEVRFKMTGDLSTANTSGNQHNRQWYIMAGEDHAETQVLGFDLRALQKSSSTFDLAWYGWDNADEGRVASILEADLNKDQFYTVVAHRKTDGNVDLYLDGRAIGTKAVIGASNPEELTAGDLATLGMYGTQVIDSVKIGTFATPEPASVVMLATALFGLLAYAWRKRK